jgi:hypothetical protein
MSRTKRSEPTRPMTPASKKAHSRVKKDTAKKSRRDAKKYVAEGDPGAKEFHLVCPNGF